MTSRHKFLREALLRANEARNEVLEAQRELERRREESLELLRLPVYPWSRW